MIPSYPRVMMWRQVEPADVIRGADGGRWMVLRRETAATGQSGTWYRATAEIELGRTNPTQTRTGSPRGTDGVTVLSRGELGQAIDAFTGAGLAVRVLSYEG